MKGLLVKTVLLNHFLDRYVEVKKERKKDDK
jgi:hypothetical protein